ncbi:hypothetical protein BDZ89DRAFT_658315 [Hymenopellis radicata]|nr:hypothetical protein BDZ89DRAFT_658315 [Hymenopellis radicata]
MSDRGCRRYFTDSTPNSRRYLLVYSNAPYVAQLQTIMSSAHHNKGYYRYRGYTRRLGRDHKRSLHLDSPLGELESISDESYWCEEYGPFSGFQDEAQDSCHTLELDSKGDCSSDHDERLPSNLPDDQVENGEERSLVEKVLHADECDKEVTTENHERGFDKWEVVDAEPNTRWDEWEMIDRPVNWEQSQL